jgi:hypothetical protein
VGEGDAVLRRDSKVASESPRHVRASEVGRALELATVLRTGSDSLDPQETSGNRQRIVHVLEAHLFHRGHRR